MLGKTAISIAVVGLFLAGGIFPSMTRGENSSRLIAHEHGGNEATGEPAASEQIKEKENVGNEFCPVSGEKIDEKSKVTYEYKGKIYNFCCQDCVEEFKKDPEKYIEKMKKEKAGTNGQDQSTHEDHH